MICGLARLSSEDFRLSIGGNEIVKKGSLLSRGCAGNRGGGSDLKRAGVIAAFIKTLHLLLKAGWGDQCGWVCVQVGAGVCVVSESAPRRVN